MGVQSSLRDSGYGKAALTPWARQPRTVRKARQPPAIIPVRARAPQDGPMQRAIFGCSAATALAGQNWQEFNDLWSYSPTSGQWTWVGGSNTAANAGSYGTPGVPAAGNLPPARTDALSWVDSAGVFWLFGGVQLNSNGSYLAVFNDLWSYNPTTALWTWVGGSNTPNAAGVYGTQGIARYQQHAGCTYGRQHLVGCQRQCLAVRWPGSEPSGTSGIQRPVGVQPRQRPVDLGRRLQMRPTPRVYMARSTPARSVTARARASRPCPGQTTPEISGYSGDTDMLRAAVSAI